MKKPEIPQFGGAMQSAIDAVIQQGATAISVADAGTKIAFLDSWTRTLTAHASVLRANKESLLAPAVIVYIEDSSELISGADWKRQPMLGTAPTDNFSGMLAVGTGEFGGSVHSQRFLDTSEFTAEIERVGIGSCLTIGLMSTGKLMIWPEGINGQIGPNVRDLDDAPIVLDLAKIEQDLDLFYSEEARQTKNWWRDPDARITVDKPERVVQDALRIFLIGRYAEIAKVREEVVSGNGRSDITIRPTNGSHDSAVLELKTTRDVRTPKRAGNKPITIPLATNVKWATMGVQQAVAYRDHEKFSGAFLCVYDFCASQGGGIDKAIQNAASKYNVIAKRYWITASHKEHREALYPVE